MNPISSTEGDTSTISQRLINASLEGDESTVDEIFQNGVVDVNHMGIVNLRMKNTVSIQHEEAADELKLEYVEFKTDVTPLFAAAHLGHVEIVKKLLTAGADVNQSLFRGYATTAATREGHIEVLRILLKAGACQAACEEALFEACLSGQVKMAELLMSWEMTRREFLASALIQASSRGLIDIVQLLVKSGLDVNSWHRVMLRSVKPVLQASVDCTALIAAIVSRQASVVQYLLQAGADIYAEARLGAWAWDLSLSEVLRVGAGMAEPYNAAWCAIEYWESDGSILRMLLEHVSANTKHQGRSLLCHAILCGNVAAVEMLIQFGAEIEYRVSANDGSQFFPIHLAARQGTASVLRTLVAHGCDVNVKTEAGDTALMLCAMMGHEECFRELLLRGADLGANNRAGQTVVEIMDASVYRLTLHRVIWEVILSGKGLHSSNIDLFSVLHFVARYGGTKAMEKILEQKNVNLNLQDRDRFSALMVAARYGNMEVLKVLLFAGASLSLRNSKGETAAMLAERFGHKEAYEQILVDALLCDVLQDADFEALHFAAKRGNLEALAYLLKRGSLVNAWDDDGYTPLMLSVKEGHIEACKLLLSFGADCYLANSRGEMALSIARRFVGGKAIEGMLLDHMAKKLVLAGGEIFKHTREGKGEPHSKYIKMLKTGILSWGRSKRRNVACIETSLGASSKFQKNRKNHGDLSNPGLFRVVTNQREIHFDAVTAFAAELWVRGIKIITKEAMDKNDL